MPITDLKIAICISGQLRKLHMTKFHRIANALGADVYIHTWDNEHNVHLSELNKFFPDAKIAIEPYEKTFDKILKLGREDFPIYNAQENHDIINVPRYNYAQVYTVMKSFNLCLGSGKKYDYIFRTRTDVDVGIGAYTKEEEFDDIIKKIKETLFYHNKHEYDEEPGVLKSSPEYTNQPFIASTIHSYNQHVAHMQDWYWIMNQPALEEMCKLTPEDYVLNSHTLKKNYQIKRGMYPGQPVLKTPSIWFKIFEELNLLVLSLTDLRVGIYRSDNPVIVPGHGDIS
jgi:hypothetical protein